VTSARPAITALASCFLEQLITPGRFRITPLLTPGTPRSACFRMQGDGKPELITRSMPGEAILFVAMWCCRNNGPGS